MTNTFHCERNTLHKFKLNKEEEREKEQKIIIRIPHKAYDRVDGGISPRTRFECSIIIARKHMIE